MKPPQILLRLFIFTVLLLSQPPFSGTAALALEWWPSPWRLEPAGTHEVQASRFSSAAAFNPEGRAWDYLVQWNNAVNAYEDVRSRICIYDDRNKVFRQENTEIPTYRVSGVDVDTDGVQEFLVSAIDDSATLLRIYDWPSFDVVSEFRLLRRDFRWVMRNRDTWDVNIEYVTPVHGVLPGRPALLLAVDEGFALLPCGLWLIDPLSGEELWHHYLCGPQGPPTIISTREGESLYCVLGADASCNGATVDSLDDQHPYVVSVDRTGKRLWVNRFDSGFGRASVCLLPGSDDPDKAEVIALYAVTSSGEGPSSRLMRIQCSTGRITSMVTAPFEVPSGYLYPWSRNTAGSTEYVVTTAAGCGEVYIVDSTLHVVASSPRKGRVLWSGDLDGNGTTEHFICDDKNRTVLVDDRFRTLASSPLFGTFIAVTRTRESAYPAIWMERDNTLYKLQPSPNRGYYPDILLRIGLAAIFGFGTTVGVRDIVRARRISRREKEVAHIRSTFAVAASMLERHEITSPITTALREASNIRQEATALVDGELPETLRDSLSQLTSELIRARDSLTPLIQILKGDPPKRRVINLYDVTAKIVDRTPLPAHVRITMAATSDFVSANLDESWLLIAVRNLLENSVKAMSDGGTIKVLVGEEQELHKETVNHKRPFLRIQDEGNGIMAEHLPHIFELGFTQSAGGKGIGLWLVKYIVSAHQAEIRCESAPGAGTTFTLVFSHAE